MGEMSLRVDRRRKDLAASFNKLKFLVEDVKSARKSLSAHHRLMAEFVSVSLMSAVPPSNLPSPRDALSSPQLDDLPIGQIYDSQHVSPTLQGPIAIPALLIESSSSESSAPMTSASPRLTAPPSVCHGSLSALSSKNLKEVRSKIFSSVCPWVAANPGRLAGQSILWASLVLVFLCFFLFMGKRVAMGITVTAYSLSWLTFKGLALSKKSPRFMRSETIHSHAAEGMGQNRSPTHVNDPHFSSSESHPGEKSQSLKILHGCAQRECYINELDHSIDYMPSTDAGKNLVRMKLGILLVLALGGLGHGPIMAVCMCSSCLLISSEMQRLTSKICKQGTRDKS